MTGSSKDFLPQVSVIAASAIAGGIVLASGGNILQLSMATIATGTGGYLSSSFAGKRQDKERGLIESERDWLKKEVERLKRNSGINAEVEYLQGKQKLLQQTIGELQAKEQELQERVQRIHQNPPNLDELEQRQQQIAALKTQINENIGRLNAISSTIIEREKQRDNLQEISAQAVQKQVEVNHLMERVSTLNQQAAELELFRSTYDALKREEVNLTNKKQSLETEMPRLQQERDRILADIEKNANRAQQADNLRLELEKLEDEIHSKLSGLKSFKRQIEQLEVEKNILEDEIARKDSEIKGQDAKLRQIEEQIRKSRLDLIEIESGTKQPFESLQSTVEIKATQERIFGSEGEFLAEFKQYLVSKGLDFSDRIIKAFHTSLKVQDISALVVLAGISGTGKSELPQAYAEFIGAPLVFLPVQPRWDSPQDLQGFYNYIEKKYKPTELMHYLYQHHRQRDLQGRIVMVLLDEMNLAKVEYYFSDFLSKLETRRNKPTFLEIDAGSLNLKPEDKKVRIPEEFLFVGTMNEDETTQSLSDKVLDRANVLTFGRPPELKLRGDQRSTFSIPTQYVSWESFKIWTKQPSTTLQMTVIVKEYVDQANEIMEALGRPFAHRVFQAFAKYVINYPNSENDEIACKEAIADQFGQKLLPKLRGVMVDESSVKEELDKMQKLLVSLGDPDLNEAFAKARTGQYGQFQWKGVVYRQE
ncbi:AAA family ATPase [Pseudanabaena sp. UWO310]|uniref:AAA family ATPase n=1 Tax=Pseudanabaena sp. UWO310 TaxID=2480795 RepID=UPI00115A166C|nr:AAA family ATPase [Pseudanabaena sp. UWO310]TYQ29255.1 AAA domain-containing protein [Pseudanabaena sp. UWO310]